MWQEISKFGRKLVEQGLVGSHFGNISVRVGDYMYITRSGSMLDEITKDDVVKVSIYRPTSLDLIASSEVTAHREIYKNTSALAIIHDHSPFAVVESLIRREMGENKIVPIDSEGSYFLHDIPIVDGGIGTEKLARNLANALQQRKAAVVYSHGVFARGSILEEAYVVASMVEHSCKMMYYYEQWKSRR
jgi:L-fuculose-phosphate aldolase